MSVYTKEGLPSICGSALIMVVFMFIHPLPAAVMCCVTGFLIWFYRDPERESPGEPGLFLSPADGKVIEIIPVSHEFTGESMKVGIFMSPLSVHVNRVPCDGVIEYMNYVPGKKWVTLAPKASEVNERFYVGLKTQHGAVLLAQIAGLLARRIVCRCKVGESLKRGERYGMIKFGSKVDIHLPKDVAIKINIGDKVYAGKTVIAEAKQ